VQLVAGDAGDDRASTVCVTEQSGLHLDAAPDTAVRTRRPDHRHEPMVGSPCSGSFPLTLWEGKLVLTSAMATG
jgi:hypothetical protein